MPQEERRDDEKMYNKKTLADLEKIAPFVSVFFIVFVQNCTALAA